VEIAMTGRDEIELAEYNERIAFVLAHPGFSPWVKEVIRSALMREPVAVLNDLETLNQVLRPKCGLEAAMCLNGTVSLH